MQELIIKSEQDVTAHFEWHEQEKERTHNNRRNFEGDLDSEEYKKLESEYDINDISFGVFGLSSDKIVMYYGHEGDVISNVQFCPFCGIKFKVQIE